MVLEGGLGGCEMAAKKKLVLDQRVTSGSSCLSLRNLSCRLAKAGSTGSASRLKTDAWRNAAKKCAKQRYRQMLLRTTAAAEGSSQNT